LRRATAALAVLLLALAPGCALRSAPPDNTGFGVVRNIDDLAGVYRNLGEQGPGSHRPVYLSQLLWPGDEKLNHAAIANIEVRKVDRKTLHVRATTAVGTVLKSGRYTRGEDFDLKHGRILLKASPRIAGAADEPVVGLAYERREIGLDTGGQGKARQTGTVVGLALALFPVAMTATEDVRFVRIAP
jgi:hypothetical protein